jgi:hypothetical protein
VGSSFDVLALLPGQLEIPTGAGDPLKLSNAFFGLGVTASGVTTFQLGGKTIFNLFGEPREIEARLIVNEEAAVASVHLKDVPIPPVHALPGVRFKEDFYLEMGVQFVPEGLDLGFMGDFYIGDNPDKYTGKVVIILELVEGVPNPLYLQFSIDKLTLWAMFEALTGTMALIDTAESGLKLADESGASGDTGLSGVTHETEHALEFLKQQYKNLQFIFDKVSLNDVAFHWSDSVVILPDGTTAMPGVGFRGWLDLFGWHTFAAFEFTTGTPTKLSAHLEMEPINLQHIVSVTGDGKGVQLREARGEKEGWEYWKDSARRKETVLRPAPAQLRATLDEPDASNGAIVAQSTQNAAEYILKPGGPVFIISSQHAPFLHANIHISLFDLLHTDVRADVDETGLSFELSTGVGSIITLVLGCKLQVKDDFRFEAYGKFGLHLNADFSFELPLIGEIPIVLDAGLDAEMHLIVTEHDFSLSIDGSFEFEGIDLTMPTLTLTVPFPSFSGLPKQILDHIEDAAEEIFGDLFGELGKLAEEAVKAVGEAVEAVAEEVEKVGEEVVKDVKVIGEAVEQAFDAAEEGVEEAANALANSAEEVASAVADEVKEIGQVAEQAAEELAHDAAVVLDAAEHAVEEIGSAVAAEVSGIADKVADIAGEAVHEVEEIGKAVAHEVQEILDTAEDIAEGAVKTAEVVAEGIEHAAEAVWDAAEDLANAAAEAAEAAANWTAHAAEDVVDFFNPF